MSGGDNLVSVIRTVLEEHGRLVVDVGTRAHDDDLYRAGLTSHATVNVMLALEDSCDVMFPERMLRKRTFESVATMREAVGELTGGPRS